MLHPGLAMLYKLCPSMPGRFHKYLQLQWLFYHQLLLTFLLYICALLYSCLFLHAFIHMFVTLHLLCKYPILFTVIVTPVQ